MHLRETFNSVPELYDRARPEYPDALYETLRALTGLSAGARVLEIAPATGKATAALARQGYKVTAVEMGEALAAVAQRNLAAYSNVSIEVSRFEDWPLPDEAFDLVCCATAFAWLDPAVRLQRCAEALRPGGYLAIWDTHHVAGGTTQFFPDSQECYERWMPGTEPGIRLTPSELIEPADYGILEHPAFEALEIRRFDWEVTYTTQTYLDVLATYSNHIALGSENYEGLFGCIRSLIDGRYGGTVTKGYTALLQLARRR